MRSKTAKRRQQLRRLRQQRKRRTIRESGISRYKFYYRNVLSAKNYGASLRPFV